HEFGWSWRDYGKLAMAAVAAQAAAWSDWEGAGASPSNTTLSLPWHVQQVELDDAGAVKVQLASATPESAAERLLSWLKAQYNGVAAGHCADVRLDLTTLQVRQSAEHQLVAEGATGTKDDGAWSLEILYQTG